MKKQYFDGRYKVFFEKVEGKYKKRYVHRQVYKDYYGEIPENMTINHINGNKLDNNIENLECISRGNNIKHAHKVGLMRYVNGETHPKSKLTEKLVRQIREDYRKGLGSTRVLAAKYNVGKSIIFNIVSNKSWKHLLEENGNVN